LDVPAGLPPINFEAHRYRMGVEGGRHEFEQMVASLVEALHGDAHRVQPARGDWGIDVAVGELGGGRVAIWQAKYFIDGIRAGQFSNIEESFRRACAGASTWGYEIDRWVLCVPVSLRHDVLRRWQIWRTEQQRATNIRVELWDETGLRDCLLLPEADHVRRAYYTAEPLPPPRRPEPRVRVRPAGDVLAWDDPYAVWRGGAELRLAQGGYLLHDPADEQMATDRSWTVRAVLARELDGHARLVWIRQVQVHRPTADSRARRDGLRAQAALLTTLAEAGGLPRLIAREGDDTVEYLLTAPPPGQSWQHTFRGLRGSPGVLDPLAVAAVLDAAAALCWALAALHRHGEAHRMLDGGSVVVLQHQGRWRARPRDLGLAGFAPAPGEGGTAPAPEQHPVGGEGTRPGPATDVYQVATLVAATLAVPVTGRATPPPYPVAPPPPGAARTGLAASESLGVLLAPALDPDPRRRPSASAFETAIRQARRELAGGGAR
jgi:hypothetical protein